MTVNITTFASKGSALSFADIDNNFLALKAAVEALQVVQTVTLSQSVSQPEGNSGTTVFMFTVSLSAAAPTGGVLVPYTYDHGSFSADDYASNVLPAASGNIPIAGGATSGSITFTIAGDTTVESDETATITITAPNGYSAGPRMTATMTATNDDVASPTDSATFTMSQLPSAGRIYQRDTETGGGMNKGAGNVSILLNVTAVGAVYARCRSAADGTTILQPRWKAVANAQVANIPVTLTGVDARLGWFYIDLQNPDGTWNSGTVQVGMGSITMMGSAQSLGGLMFVKEPSAGSTIAQLGLTPSPYSRCYAVNKDIGREVATPEWSMPDTGATYDSAGAVKYLNNMITRLGVNCAFAGAPAGGRSANAYAVTGEQLYRMLPILDAIGGFEYYMTFIGHTDSLQNTGPTIFRTCLTGCMDICTHRNSRGQRFTTISTAIPLNTNSNSWGNEAQKANIRRYTYDWVNLDAVAQCTAAYYMRADNVDLFDGVHETNTGAVTLADLFTSTLVNGSDTRDATVGSYPTLTVQNSHPDTLVFASGEDYAQSLQHDSFAAPSILTEGTGIISVAMRLFISGDTGNQTMLYADNGIFVKSNGEQRLWLYNTYTDPGMYPLNQWFTLVYEKRSFDLDGNPVGKSSLWVNGVKKHEIDNGGLTGSQSGYQMGGGFGIRQFNYDASYAITDNCKVGKVAVYNKALNGVMPSGQFAAKEARRLIAMPLNGDLSVIL